ncbi:hypothetical protein BGX28_002499 [Mortierella sp. GBA30]|nr:hypothetical protein BGX28_002499 [Mortierella sp. GBA30]
MSLRGRQLFIGNIPFSVGWQDLKDLFRGAGVVLRANVMLGRDGRSKGHGIVLFATLEDAKKAQDKFNGYEWHGRPLEVREEVNDLAESLDKKLTVDPSSEHQERTLDLSEQDAATIADKDSVARDETSGAGATKPIQGRTIHVGNIPFRVRWQDLKDLFRKAGHVIRADVAMGPDSRSRGFGTVLFSNEDEAKKAIAMFDQYQWQDRVIQVQEERIGQENGRHHEGSSAHGMGSGPYHLGPYFRNPPPMNNFAAARQVFVGNVREARTSID